MSLKTESPSSGWKPSGREIYEHLQPFEFEDRSDFRFGSLPSSKGNGTGFIYVNRRTSKTGWFIGRSWKPIAMSFPE
jgi:hypothetical protein